MTSLERSGPSVSIITPVLRRADSIRGALASVAAQTHPNIEHIVVDGGSDDGTVEEVERFARAHPAVRWVSEPDDGMYDAINKGLELASGEVLAYLNSDDRYFPWTVEVALQALKRHELVYGDLAVWRQDPDPAFYVQFYPDFDRRLYTYEATLAQPTVFWRRTVQSRIGTFDDSYRLIADCEYWLRAARSGILPFHIREVLAVQIEHATTLRAQNPELLQTEFSRLRTAYSPWAGTPRRGGVARIAKSLRWRRDELSLLLATRRLVTGWPHFTRWLSANRIQLPASYFLLHLLPPGLRPGDLSLTEIHAVERAMEDAFA